MPGPSKQPDMPLNMVPMPPMPPMPTTTVRTKKRAAMATSVVANTASAIRKYFINAAEFYASVVGA